MAILSHPAAANALATAAPMPWGLAVLVRLLRMEMEASGFGEHTSSASACHHCHAREQALECRSHTDLFTHLTADIIVCQQRY